MLHFLTNYCSFITVKNTVNKTIQLLNYLINHLIIFVNDVSSLRIADCVGSLVDYV